MAHTKTATAQKSNTQATAPAPQAKQVPKDAKDEGFLANGANWLLSRLPWFKYRYEGWSKTKRIVVGFLMYLVVLPVIPIVVAIVWYVRDPEGFKSSKLSYVLGGIIVAWLGAFGMIAAQPSYSSASIKSADATSISKEAKDAIKDKKDSAQTLGRQFENCDAAFKAGVFNIQKTDPSYASKLDRDNDGIACEKN